MQVTRIGLDIAKNVFQVHGVDEHGKVVLRKQLNLAGKVVHTARRCFLMLSDRYRYQAVWRLAIGRLTHLQFG